jgi:GGDEF domain-containing protein
VNAATGYGLGATGGPYGLARDERRWIGPVAQVALLAGLAVLAGLSITRLAGPDLGAPTAAWLGVAIVGGAALLCLVRASVSWDDRVVWILFGVALACPALREAYLWGSGLSLGDLEATAAVNLLYLAFYPLGAAALILLVRERMLLVPATLWLDAALAALALTTLNTPLLAKLIATQGAGTLEVAAQLAHPLADALLLGLVIGVLALPGFRPDRSEGLLLGGLALVAIADAAFMLQSVDAVPGEASWIRDLWPLGAALVALAAWEPGGKALRWPMDAWRPIVMPTATAAVALSVYVLAPTETAVALGASLAVATLAALVARMMLALVDNRRLLRAAHTDHATGLWNRARLHADLAAGPNDVHDPVRVVAVFRLAGLARYGEAFGNSAADALLARLGARLSGSIRRAGRAYRTGPEDMCVVLEGRAGRADELLREAASALEARGEGYEISISSSVVSVPYEAHDGVSALNIAEERLQTAGGQQRHSASRQAEVRLMRTLQERHPELGVRSSMIPELARAVGRRLGIGPDELRLVSHAAELSEMGRMLLPEEIRNKPGRLEEGELEVVRGHTMAAEQLIASDPALVPVARVVRSAAERWDGAGYPDGLAGNEIPLPSRIIFACDAYEAMTSERPYRPALSRRQALSELRQNAGTQFDPQAVAALCAVVEDDIGRYSPAPAPQSPAGPGRTRRGSVPPPSATARR